MSNAKLEALRPILETIPIADVDEPDMPMPVLLQEAHDLYEIINDDPVRSDLIAVGIDAQQIGQLPDIIDATRAAQSQWVVVRDRHKAQAQQAREQQGHELRGELLDACRFNLRRDKKAMETIQDINEGEGIPDLIQDLVDIATLIDGHLGAFVADTTFDAPAKAEEARSLSADIETGTSVEREGTTREDSKELRDRAFTYLAQQVSELREAGRYRYRNDPRQRARFSSAYERRQRRRQSRGKGEPEDGGAPAE
jgi:hypothetical protein